VSNDSNFLPPTLKTDAVANKKKRSTAENCKFNKAMIQRLWSKFPPSQSRKKGFLLFFYF
ncbi:hypothetical protein ILYODFUR_018279, partial [Ilyodon furcidens]